MDLDPELLKQLIVTFTGELEEKTQAITDSLLKLEKLKPQDKEFEKMIEVIFRAAHNIKGAARGIGAVEVGEIAHHLETLFSHIQKGKIRFTSDIVNLCLEALDAMRGALKLFVDKTPLTFDLHSLLKSLEKGEQISKSDIPKTKTKEKKDIKKENEVIDSISATAENETIRVSLSNLDHVSALMEEIQINKIAIDDHYADLTKLLSKTKQISTLWDQGTHGFKENRFESLDSVYKMVVLGNDFFTDIFHSTQRLHKSMRAHINELTILSNSLQEEIRRLRLIPAATLLRTLPRITRELALSLNKEIEIHIKGDQVKMDKMILEGLQDPIMHLIRNAIDHGIESSKTRLSLGKPKAGQITVQVVDEGNQILISISDDGAGIDVAEITRLAEAKNWLTKTELQGMSESEILDLIFQPGFSTKEIITDLSGRGVGLDVVKINLANLKGNVSVSTEAGKGTTFYLRVPLTLASDRGLIVSVAGNKMIIPITHIERVLTLKPQEIKDVEGGQAVIFDQQAIVLKSLAEMLDLEKTEFSSDQIYVVVLAKSPRAVGLLVDNIIGEREIVIKPLQPPLNNLPLVSGGALSGNGEVMLVLNSNELLNIAQRETHTSKITFQDSIAIEEIRPSILVVDDSITTRTLEKNILETHGYAVTVAVDGKEAWELLQKQPFSLLITDVAMPEMDGFTLTQNVKSSEKLRDLPVIIVTSLGSEAEKKRGIEAGANAYIVKNEFESESLLQIVTQLV